MDVKIYFFLVVAFSPILSCVSDSSMDLKRANSSRDSVIELSRKKDTIIAAFMNSLDRIKNNLQNIQNLENELSDEQEKINAINQKDKVNLNKDIKVIKGLLDINQKAVVALNLQLDKAQREIDIQNELIITLNAQLLDKTIELENLYSYLLIKNKTIK
jgi:anion-transporting  ArsA/GET3 family ATPase